MDLILVGSTKKERMQFEQLRFSLNDAEQLAAGILWGAVEAEGLDNIKGCVSGAELIFDDVKAALQDFEEETPEGVIAGLKELADTIFAIGQEVHTCKGVIADFEKLGEMAAIFSNPVTLVYHIAKDLIVNGVNIYHEINDSITQYRANNWLNMGEDIGKAFAQLLLGMEQQAEYGYIQSEENLFLY